MRSLAVAIALIGGVSVGPPTFELPAPTGPSPVGTTEWRLTDSARQETLDPAGGPRQVEAHAWYPAVASPTAHLAPYVRDGKLISVRSFASAIRGSDNVFDDLAGVRTHAALDAEPATTPARIPVLVFSHGYTGVPSAYTALLEDLASHGFAVISVVHPYEASGATLSDGRVVTMFGDDGKFRPGVQAVFDEWQAEDETMAAITRTTDEREQRRLMRGYLSGLRQTVTALSRWVADLGLVLDRLSTLPPSSAAGRLASRLDLASFGVFGHSMGGVTAAEYCRTDRRCKAALNLDGIPQYGTMIDAASGPPLLMVYSARPGRAGASDVIYKRAASPYYRVDVSDTGHLDFSDMAFWPTLRERGILGRMPATQVTGITRRIVREFFEQELRGRRSPLLGRETTIPGVTVR
jgi:dienelactone hydrolase